MSEAKTTFVTGAGSGIGRAAALRLAARGDSLALFDRSAEGLAESVAAIQAGGVGHTPIAIVGDVGSDDVVAGAFVRTADEIGTLDAVVACAGIEVTGAIPDMAIEDWHRVLSVNLTGVFLTARHGIRAMRGGGGSFVAISSDGGVQGSSDWGAYCATKHGVIGLVRCLALDHGREGIRANCVCPGLTRTPMADRVLADAADPVAEERAWTRLVPAGRLGRAEEIADAVAFLTSAESSFVNGHSLVADGGATAGYFFEPV
jgi:NAD(P)-dependent dehydrogenase (short-subunit alcohol dehydrogenase family)